MTKSLRATERDPLRQSLSEAIERRDTIAANIQKLEAALPDLRTTAFRAADALEKANENLQRAKSGAIKAIVGASVGEVGEEEPQTVEVARRHLTAAEDNHEIQRGALNAAKARLAEEQTALTWAASKVDKAALDVLVGAPQIATLLAELEAIQRAFIDKSAALNWLVGKDIISKAPVSDGLTTRPALAETLMARFQSPPATWRELLMDTTIPGASPWIDALARLRKHADSPLP